MPEPVRSSHGSLTPFMVLWSGQAASLIGSQAVQFALIWWLTLQSGSPTTLSAAMAPIGLLLAAPVASVVGIRAWFLAGGATTLTMGMLAFMIPAILRIESDSPAHEAAAAGEPPVRC